MESRLDSQHESQLRNAQQTEASQKCRDNVRWADLFVRLVDEERFRLSDIAGK